MTEKQNTVKKLIKEPLLHFALIGVGVFLLYSLFGPKNSTSQDVIVLKQEQVKRLADIWSRVQMRPPSREELAKIVEDFLKEEIYYREALAMGLDKDDTIIRRRLRQKMEFLSEDVLSRAEPTDQVLRDYFTQHKDQFRAPVLVSFDQEFDGDLVLLPKTFDWVTESAVDGQFGQGFFAQLVDLPVKKWSGPIKSGYGLHRIYIRQKQVSPDPSFEEVKTDVRREWYYAKRMEAREAFYEELRSRYKIEVEGFIGGSN